VVRDMIGHSSAAVSQNYSHVDAEVKRRAVESMPHFKAKPREWSKADEQTGLKP
jgi:hypothetical protein